MTAPAPSPAAPDHPAVLREIWERLSDLAGSSVTERARFRASLTAALAAVEAQAVLKKQVLAVIYEEGRGKPHGVGALKVERACLKMEERIKLLPFQFDPVVQEAERLREQVGQMSRTMCLVANALHQQATDQRETGTRRDRARSKDFWRLTEQLREALPAPPVTP